MLLSKRVNNTYIHIVIIVVTVIGVFRNILEYKDLQSGDTASYFQEMYTWSENGTLNLAWSPLYSITLGALNNLTFNAFNTLIGLRITIVLIITILLYFSFRNLILPLGSLLLTIWWAILPINYDSVYTVHLFSIILPLLSLLISTLNWKDIRFKDVMISSLLLTSSILSRNEHLLILIGWLFFLSVSLIIDKKIIIYVKGFRVRHLTPLLASFLLVFFCFSKSTYQTETLNNIMHNKHVVNVCMIYSFNQQQHGDTWSKSPWTECQDMMQRDFGEKLPTLREAFIINPKAIIRHFYYNLLMIPDGIQLGLFNGYSGPYNPDFIPAKRSYIFLALFFISFILIMVYYAKYYNFNKNIYKDLSFDSSYRSLLLLILFSLATLAVILMQRPRPSYMFMMNIALMSLIIYCFSKLIVQFYSVAYNKYLLMGLSIALILSGTLIFPVYKSGYINYPSSSTGQYLNLTYKRFKKLPEFSFKYPKGPTKTSISLTRQNQALSMYLNKNIAYYNLYDILIDTDVGDIEKLISKINNKKSEYYYLESETLDTTTINSLEKALKNSNYSIRSAGYDSYGRWLILKKL